MSGVVVLAEYEGMPVSFDDDGWFNATAPAKRFGKVPKEWLRLPETRRYLRALVKSTNGGKSPIAPNAGKSRFARTQRGGRAGEAGTWLHPKLAVRFAQWLDADFAVWCDDQIERLIHGRTLLPVGLYAQRIAFEGTKAKSEQKGTIGARLMNERRREKPALEKQAAAWKIKMEPGLFPVIERAVT